MFDKVMAINVRGVFLGLKYVLPTMIAQGKGAVVNTASLGAYVGTRHLGPYTASKHAVLGLTKTAALEVARKGIRVNAVSPGPVDTDMIREIEAAQAAGSAQSLRQQRAASIPDGRYADPAEVANLMVYLASDYASHITGQGMQINGVVAHIPWGMLTNMKTATTPRRTRKDSMKTASKASSIAMNRRFMVNPD
eukprot:gene35336-58272_t